MESVLDWQLVGLMSFRMRSRFGYHFSRPVTHMSLSKWTIESKIPIYCSAYTSWCCNSYWAALLIAAVTVTGCLIFSPILTIPTLVVWMIPLDCNPYVPTPLRHLLNWKCCTCSFPLKLRSQIKWITSLIKYMITSIVPNGRFIQVVP